MEGYIGDTSFEEIMSGVAGETIQEKQRTLLSRLLNRGHFGPFEHPTLTVSIKGVSRSCMAQLTRHRVASFDVQSMRYVSFDDVDPEEVKDGELVVVPPSAGDPEWVGRNQQTGAVDEETARQREKLIRQSFSQSVEQYQQLLELGMPPEDARFVLPIGTQTNIVMSVNMRTLMHIADMRHSGEAQWEIRELTGKVLDRAADWAPLSFEIYRTELKGRKNKLAP
jgi:thymidylate synthase (FAD)